MMTVAALAMCNERMADRLHLVCAPRSYEDTLVKLKEPINDLESLNIHTFDF
jgi:hypothetical protein